MQTVPACVGGCEGLAQFGFGTKEIGGIVIAFDHFDIIIVHWLLPLQILNFFCLAHNTADKDFVQGGNEPEGQTLKNPLSRVFSLRFLRGPIEVDVFP